MEYLDTYDENKNFLGKETRDYAHTHGLWHNTVHCWLYDNKGNIYFQIRADENTFYTTASGHVDAGETIKEAFGREIKEEIGINLDYNNAILVDIVTWKMDKIKKDGSLFKDRAFANVYILNFEGNINDFQFDLKEVKGLVKVNAIETLKLFKEENKEIFAEIITTIAGINTIETRKVKMEEFLVTKDETAIDKYGAVLNKVISLTNN